MAGGNLADIRVIELVDEQAEYCGRLLAGLGADVIKLEPPAGSPTRRIGPFAGDRSDPERSLFFWQYNLGKRSVVLDLEQLSTCPLRRVRDMPADGERLVADAPTGIDAVLVNGTPIRVDGKPIDHLLDELPGDVLRSAPPGATR